MKLNLELNDIKEYVLLTKTHDDRKLAIHSQANNVYELTDELVTFTEKIRTKHAGQKKKYFTESEVNQIIALSVAHSKMVSTELKNKTEEVWESFYNPNETIS